MVATGVRVAVRTRPMSKKEEQLGSKCCVYINEAKAEVKIQDLKKKDSDSRQDEGGGGRLFTFDFAYGSDSQQDNLYKELGHPLLQRALVRAASTLGGSYVLLQGCMFNVIVPSLCTSDSFTNYKPTGPALQST